MEKPSFGAIVFLVTIPLLLLAGSDVFAATYGEGGYGEGKYHYGVPDTIIPGQQNQQPNEESIFIPDADGTTTPDSESPSTQKIPLSPSEEEQQNGQGDGGTVQPNPKDMDEQDATDNNPRNDGTESRGGLSAVTVIRISALLVGVGGFLLLMRRIGRKPF